MGASFVVAPFGRYLKPNGSSRRLHNRGETSRRVHSLVSERRLLRERKSLIYIGTKRPRAHVLEARKEYNLSVLSYHTAGGILYDLFGPSDE